MKECSAGEREVNVMECRDGNFKFSEKHRVLAC